MTYRYEMKLKKSRDCVDLRRYGNRITQAIRDGIGFGKVQVKVGETYYEYKMLRDITRGELIRIGKNIAKYCPELHKYGYLYKPKIGKPILQLFRRVREVN